MNEKIRDEDDGCIEILIVAGEIRHWNPATRLYESEKTRDDERFGVFCEAENWEEEQKTWDTFENCGE